MSKPNNVGILFILLALIVVQFFTYIQNISLGLDNIVANLTVDDSYYYLETAWRTPISGFVTFDGINPTNGVQFLWFWILVLVRQFAQDKDIFLYFALHVCFVFNLIGYLFIYAIGKRIHPMVIVGIATLWLFLTAEQTAMLSVMEASLYGLIFWIILYLLIVIWEHIESEQLSAYELPLFAFVLSLLVWTRIDAGLYAVGFFLLIAWKLSRHHRFKDSIKMLVIPSLIALFMGILLITGFYLMGNSLIPVSGIIKSDTFSFNISNLSYILAAIINNVLPGFSYLKFNSLPISVIVTLSGGVFVLWLLMRIYVRNPRAARLRISHYLSQIGTFVLALVCIHIIYLTSISTQLNYTVWYYAPMFIVFIIVIVTGLVYLILPILGLSITWVVVAIFAIGIGGFTYFNEQQNAVGSWHVQRKNLAIRLSDSLPSDVVMASWNAGELAYFSKQPLVNLDGLINSYEYYDTVLRHGDNELTDYLKQKNVEYVIDYTIKADISSDYVIVREFEFAWATFLLYQLDES